MERKITFNELRKIKDSLPDGAVHQLAQEFNTSVETIRNYFGGSNYDRGNAAGVHLEAGPFGGIVLLDDIQILERAEQLIKEHEQVHVN